MPIEEEDMIVSTVDYFVTENTLNPLATPTEVASFVRDGKHTGDLRYVTNQGGVRSILFVERMKLTDDEGNEVRKALGMDYEVEVAPGEVVDEE
jgi:hypothetical protein